MHRTNGDNVIMLHMDKMEIMCIYYNVSPLDPCMHKLRKSHLNFFQENVVQDHVHSIM